MTQLILISHGEISRAIRDAAFDISGYRNDIHALAIRTGEAPDILKSGLKKLASAFPDENKIVLCDIAGGTPLNVAINLLTWYPETTQIFSGLNLPMVLSYMKESSHREKAWCLYQDGIAGIKDINEKVNDFLK